MFLADARNAISITSGIMYIIHPEQYQMGRDIQEKMIKRNRCASTVREWPSVMSALSIISNRETPYHRDTQSRMTWYDLLTSVGPYTIAPLYLSPFRFRIDNIPGTICAFSGMALRHGVRKCELSRISFAWYMREPVRDGEFVDPAGWMAQLVYRDLIGPITFGIRSSCIRRA